MRLQVPWFLVLLSGCVPSGPPTQPDAGAPSAPPQKPKAAATAQAPRAAARPDAGQGGSSPLGAGFEDTFERAALGSDWRVTGGDWRIDEGRLCGKSARNHPVWLARALPVNVRIEFDAVSYSPEGDIKAEVFGDGASAATASSYNDATSYLTIFGGWKNHFHVLARLNEHASDRPEIRIAPGSDDERARPVVMGQVYHFKIERTDGRTISWWIGDTLMFRFTDPQPLSGVGHDHFGFNDWEIRVCFDNVKVTPV